MSPKAIDQNSEKQQQQQQLLKKSQKSLRICCYGSSSSRTQERYTNDAYNLGYTLCKRGHTCVNGAGRFGCMGALNSGAEDASKDSTSSSNLGKVVGVIHEMFIKDTVGGEGGSSSKSGSKSGNGRSHDWLAKCAPVFSTCNNAEIRVAGGNDLQERKRMLVEGVDALIVMPGGPGTFDEVCFNNVFLFHSIDEGLPQKEIHPISLTSGMGDGVFKANWNYQYPNCLC